LLPHGARHEQTAERAGALLAKLELPILVAPAADLEREPRPVLLGDDADEIARGRGDVLSRAIHQLVQLRPAWRLAIDRWGQRRGDDDGSECLAHESLILLPPGRPVKIESPAEGRDMQKLNVPRVVLALACAAAAAAGSMVAAERSSSTMAAAATKF